MPLTIFRFGHSARDVFDAVFDYTQSTRVHQAAFGVSHTQLEEAISFMAGNQATAKLSYWILALSPVYSNPYTNDDWTVNFKSDWVARGIIQHFNVAERKVICRQLLQRFSQASAMAGYFLDPDTHHLPSQSAGQT